MAQGNGSVTNDDLFEAINSLGGRLDRVDRRLATIEDHLERVDRRLDHLEQRSSMLAELVRLDREVGQKQQALWRIELMQELTDVIKMEIGGRLHLVGERLDRLEDRRG